MDFNFRVVSYGRQGSPIPRNIIRVTQKTITFGESIVERFAQHVEPTNKGQKIHLRVEVDEKLQAIYIAPDKSGFSFTVASGNAHNNLTMGLREVLVVGDYKEIEGHNNIFVLAK